MVSDTSRRSYLKTAGVLATGALSAGLAGCTTRGLLGGESDHAAEWSSFRRDASNSAAVPGGDSSLAEIDLEWSYSLPDGAGFQPAVSGGRLYVGSRGGTLRALRVVDGQEEWSSEIGGTIDTTPAVGDGRLYVVTDQDSNESVPSGVLSCVDTETGDQEWQFTAAGGNIGCSPTLEGEQILFSVYDRLYALRRDGTELWSKQLSAISGGETLTGGFSLQTRAFGPVADDGTVYVGGPVVAAFDRASGALRWSAETGSTRPISIDEDLLYAPRGDRLIALDASDGSVVWESILDSFALSSVARGPDGVLVTAGFDRDPRSGRYSRLLCLDESDGSVLWETIRVPITGPPVVAGDAVVAITGVGMAADEPTEIAVFDATRGTVVGIHRTESVRYSSPVVVDGTLYATGNEVRAYAPTDR